MPKPVLGAATLLMFGSIAVAGVRILASETFTRKRIYVIALSLGFSLGLVIVPEALTVLPDDLRQIFGSPITLSGVIAITATLLIPDGAGNEED